MSDSGIEAPAATLSSASHDSAATPREGLRVVTRPLWRAVLCVGAACLAFGLRSFLVRFTGEMPPSFVFMAVILLVSLASDAWTGIATTFVSALIVDYWILAPAGSLRIAHPNDQFALAQFLVAGMATSVLVEFYHRSNERAAALQAEHAVAEERRVNLEQSRLLEELQAQAERLREAEDRWSTTVNFVPQIVWMCSPDGNNVFFNQRWVDYTGLTLDASYGQNWIKPFHQDDQPAALEAWRNAVRTGQVYEVESRICGKDGSYRWFLMRGMPMRASDGTIERWFGTCTDIEDLKRADEELRLTKQRFELAIRHSPVSVFNQDLDLSLTWVYNPMPGFDPNVMLGKRDSEFLDRAEDAALTEAPKLEAIRTGIAQRAEVRVYQHDKLRIYDLLVEPLRDASGRITGVTCVSIDITERMEQDELLRQSEARFRSMYSATLEYIGLMDTAGNLIDCNGAALQFANSTRDEVVGKPIWETPWFRHTPGAAELCRAAVVKAAAGERFQTEITVVRPKGEEMIFDFSLTPVLDSEGKVAYIVPEGREITALKRAQSALVTSEKLAAVGRLASSIAHEINNPLEAVTNTLFLAKTNLENQDAAREYLDMADEELKRMAHVTRQTLGFYRESVNPVSVPLQSIVDSAVELHKRRILTRKAEVRRQYQGEFQVLAVPGELRQVFSNLLANSLDAVDTGGVVAIRVSRGRFGGDGSPELRVMVADNGSGIEPANLERIFEPLFTTKVATGSGLGLWVSRQIVEKHGGRMNVRSRTAGAHRGTTFTIALPIPEPSGAA